VLAAAKALSSSRSSGFGVAAAEAALVSAKALRDTTSDGKARGGEERAPAASLCYIERCGTGSAAAADASPARALTPPPPLPAGRAGAVDPIRAPLGVLACKVAGCSFTGGSADKYALLLNMDKYLQFVCPCPDPLLADEHHVDKLKSECKQLVPAARRGEHWHLAAVEELRARKALKEAGGGARG